MTAVDGLLLPGTRGHDPTGTDDAAPNQAAWSEPPVGPSPRSRHHPPRCGSRRRPSSRTGRGEDLRLCQRRLPGAAISQVFDSDDTTAVGGFIFDPTGPSQVTAFTFTGGAYQTLTVPGSTATIATGITTNGLISGAYADLSGTAHGFTLTGGSFTNIDFPAATATLAIGVNDLDRSWAASPTPPDHTASCSKAEPSPRSTSPWPTSTTALGINDAAEIAGSYIDAAGNQHGFVFAGGAFSTVDAAGAVSSQLTRINNSGPVTGMYTDAVTGVHGLIGQ
jgi:hypothetical protein